MLDPSLEERIRKRLESSSFPSWLGFKLTALGDGTSEIRMTLEEHHRNPGGIAHGGVIASMLDSAVGLALRTRLGMTTQHVTVNLSIDYLRVAAGDTLIARGRAIKDGQRITFGEASLYDENERELARATATFLVLPERPLSAVGPTLDGE